MDCRVHVVTKSRTWLSGFHIQQPFSMLLLGKIILVIVQYSSVQWLSHVWLFATQWTAVWQAYMCITNSQSLLKLMAMESMMPSNQLILPCPLLLLPSISPRIRVFSNESVLHNRWPKYWSFSFSISPSSEYSGLIFFTMDWFDLLAVQGTLKSLLQHHSSKASNVHYLAFFIVQLSNPFMTTGKTIALTRWTFVDKVISLYFNMLSMLAIAFLPRSKCLLISSVQSPSAVIFGAQENKVTVSIVSPSICHEVMGLDAMILVFWMLSFKPTFSLSSFTFIRRLFSSSSCSPIWVLLLLLLSCVSRVWFCAIHMGGHLHIWDYWYFSWQSWFQLVLHPAQHFAWCTLHIN